MKKEVKCNPEYIKSITKQWEKKEKFDYGQ